MRRQREGGRGAAGYVRTNSSLPTPPRRTHRPPRPPRNNSTSRIVTPFNRAPGIPLLPRFEDSPWRRSTVDKTNKPFSATIFGSLVERTSGHCDLSSSLSSQYPRNTFFLSSFFDIYIYIYKLVTTGCGYVLLPFPIFFFPLSLIFRILESDKVHREEGRIGRKRWIDQLHIVWQ